MKVSQEQKLETRRKIINAAADLFVINGFDDTSMKHIAREAGIGDATIYKYFPNKDKLILGFYEVRGADAIASYHNVDGLEEYNFAEKLQLLIDTYLEKLIADREFVTLSLKQFSKSPISLLKDELNIVNAYKEEFKQLLSELDDNEDYPSIPMPSIIATLLTDYLLGITLYWIKDDSEEFSNTTQLTDLSINMIDTTLKSGLVNKAMDMFGFVIKTHIIRGLSGGGNILSLMQEFKQSMAAHTNNI